MSDPYLTEHVELPVEENKVSPGGDVLYHHLRELFGRVEEYLVDANKEVNNLVISGGVSNVFTLGVPSDDGTYPNGTWRIYSSSTGYTIQQRQSGTWTTVATYDTAGKLTITNLTVGSLSGLATLTSGVLGVTTDNTDNWNDAFTHTTASGSSHSDVVLNSAHRTSDGTDHSSVVLNNTHRASNGSDHSDVVLNTTHRSSDGKNHSDVVLNNTHRTSDGKDHSDVVLNNTHRSSDGKDHSDVVLNNTHRTSDGTDHTYIDQDVQTSASPSFAGLTKIGGATDYLEVESDGSIELHGDATAWDDLQVSISNVRVPASNAPTERLYAFGIGSGVTFPTLGFAVNDYMYFDVQTSHSMKLNTALDHHIHFTLPNTTDIGDKFKFQLDVIAAGINAQWAVPSGSPFTAEHTIVANDDTYHRLLDTADIPAANTTVSTLYKCKLTRIAASADEYGSEVYINFTDCHYEKDTLGSRQEASK